MVTGRPYCPGTHTRTMPPQPPSMMMGSSSRAIQAALEVGEGLAAGVGDGVGVAAYVLPPAAISKLTMIKPIGKKRVRPLGFIRQTPYQ